MLRVFAKRRFEVKMILHICVIDKFIAPFHAFIRENFADGSTQHLFYVAGKSAVYTMPYGENIYVAHEQKPIKRYAWLIKNMSRADKIILHGLWDFRVLQLLFAQPWLLKKCYWTIWGGDLYTCQLDERTFNWWKTEIFRRAVIKRIGHFITHIKGDYELAQQWYGAKGQWHNCFMYPSNLYQEPLLQSLPHDGVNILLGNSADPSNNHIEILDKLKHHAREDVRIYCPLSYGDMTYAKKVIAHGQEYFGEKFTPLTEFMPFEEYLELLVKIDIAVFNHKRQQGMGNTTTLLGWGKKVYIRSDVTPWPFFKSIGITLFCTDHFNIAPIAPDVSEKNKSIISSFFSEKNLIKKLEEIFS